jgi:photosystem II stability/assembly factor-like uncharacterized protein
MDETEPAGLSPRALRGMALIALALVVMAVGVAAYLRASAPHRYSGPPPPATSQAIPVSMEWRTAAQGWVVVHDAGGPESVLFRTTSGGARWERQFSINGPAFVRFTDAGHGILRANAAQAAGAQLLRTDDGGANWRPVILPPLDPGTGSTPFFVDRDRGWLLTVRYSATAAQQAEVFGTADGGQSWLPLSTSGLSTASGDVLGELAFVSASAGWVFGTGQAGHALLFVTRDGGATWAPEALPIGTTGPRATDRVDVGPPMIAAGGRGVLPVYDRDGAQGWLYATGDGGASWGDPRPLPVTAGPRFPAFVDASTGWTCDSSVAWLTADGGRTWRPTGGLPDGWQFSAIAAVSASEAWASAAQGGRNGALGPVRWALFRTTDAGIHWIRAAMPSLG